ncbi:hypothetical protein OG455_38955 [Kitasatospora sp. NBC_01287]|uniref:hypothetical protein n=1 Tax=Kitasatospora sp. NBC_01287 TaxID=2903573 RepID=UPI0022542D26|nr:hypothetical protein [Kitasatospora sp. NBC_01287]MCX4751415.1 hypothetical protein [Kitasatospora sp. NBC_01287]
MIETTEHKATLTPRFGSVVAVRNDRMGAVLALSAGAETARPAKLNAEQCRELSAYLARQATALEGTEKVEWVSVPTSRQAAGASSPGLYDRPTPRPLAGIDSHWEAR